MSREKLWTTLFVIILALRFRLTFSSASDEYSYAILEIEDDLSFSQDEKYGHLTGDIQNWAAIIQNYIIQVCI